MTKSAETKTLLNIRKVDKEGRVKKVSIDTSGREVAEEEALTTKEPVVEEFATTIREPEEELELGEMEEVDWREYAEVLPRTFDAKKMMSLLELPKNPEEKKVWQEWNKKLNAADREYFFHEELPTYKETEKQKPEEIELSEEDIEFIKIPRLPEFDEQKNEWIEPKKEVELPIWMQEGHEDEADPVDEKTLDELLAQEFASEKGELPAPKVPKTEFRDWEPPKLEELAFLSERAGKERFKLPGPAGEKAKLRRTPEALELDELVRQAVEKLEAKVDQTANYQFKERKKKADGFWKKINGAVRDFSGLAKRLKYDSLEKIKQASGLENLSGKMANILSWTKNLTETNLSNIAGSTMLAGRELRYLLLPTKEEKRLKKKYKGELKETEERIKKMEKTEGRDEEALNRLRELRNILAAAR